MPPRRGKAQEGGRQQVRPTELGSLACGTPIGRREAAMQAVCCGIVFLWLSLLVCVSPGLFPIQNLLCRPLDPSARIKPYTNQRRTLSLGHAHKTRPKSRLTYHHHHLPRPRGGKELPNKAGRSTHRPPGAGAPAPAP